MIEKEKDNTLRISRYLLLLFITRYSDQLDIKASDEIPLQINNKVVSWLKGYRITERWKCRNQKDDRKRER